LYVRSLIIIIVKTAISGKYKEKRNTYDNSWKAAPALGLKAIVVTTPV
jgi:hypothetical protein